MREGATQAVAHEVMGLPPPEVTPGGEEGEEEAVEGDF